MTHLCNYFCVTSDNHCSKVANDKLCDEFMEFIYGYFEKEERPSDEREEDLQGKEGELQGKEGDLQEKEGVLEEKEEDFE